MHPVAPFIYITPPLPEDNNTSPLLSEDIHIKHLLSEDLKKDTPESNDLLSIPHLSDKIRIHPTILHNIEQALLSHKYNHTTVPSDPPQPPHMKHTKPGGETTTTEKEKTIHRPLNPEEYQTLRDASRIMMQIRNENFKQLGKMVSSMPERARSRQIPAEYLPSYQDAWQSMKGYQYVLTPSFECIFTCLLFCNWIAH